MHFVVCFLTLLFISSASAQDVPDLPYDVAPWPKEGHRPQPEYPVDALKAAVEGLAKAHVDIDSAGHVAMVAILWERPEHLGFGQATYSALWCWLFEPAIKEGIPVTASCEMTFRFLLLPFVGNQPSKHAETQKVFALLAEVDSVTKEHTVDGNKLAKFQPPPVVGFIPIVTRDIKSP